MGWTLAFVSGAEIVLLCRYSMIALGHVVFCCEFILKLLSSSMLSAYWQCVMSQSLAEKVQATEKVPKLSC